MQLYYHKSEDDIVTLTDTETAILQKNENGKMFFTNIKAKYIVILDGKDFTKARLDINPFI